MDEKTRRRLAEVERRRAELDAEEAAIYQEAARLLLERPGPRIAERLRSVDTTRIIPDEVTGVDTANMPLHVRVAVGRTQRVHPASKAWLKAGKSVGDIALEIGEGRPRVNSWLNDGDGNRPIPRKHAEYFKATYKIPLSAWRRIKD